MAKTETKAADGEDQSMEEILQSIRRIIAEDGDEEAAVESQASGSPAVEEDKPEVTVTAAAEEPPAEDVLELTDMVTETGAVVTVNEPDPEAVEPVEEEPSDGGNDDVLKNIDAMLGNEQKPQASLSQNADSLLSESAAEAASQALKSLKKPAVETSPPAVDSMLFRSGSTVEDLMMELMRPMLKSWLDTNLPKIVESIVEREVRKLTQ